MNLEYNETHKKAYGIIPKLENKKSHVKAKIMPKIEYNNTYIKAYGLELEKAKTI